MTSVYVLTQGCSANQSDSEYMLGLLKEAKFIPVPTLEDADIVIYNTCTVKTPSENAFFKHLDELKLQYPYKLLVIAGCIAQTDQNKLKGYPLVGTRQIHRIVEVVEEALNNNIITALETGEMPPLNLPKVRKNPLIEIIPISRGCLSACTFCKTKEARGNLESYPIEDIVLLAKKALQEGVKEFWLTSQDTLCYGFDRETDVTSLLQQLLALPGTFKIRLGMGNPVHLKKIKDKLFPLLAQEKMYQFFHLPLQSGSDSVLKQMRRGNTKEEWLSLVKELRQQIPTLTLATDIIVGYPTETDDDHWQTLTAIRESMPDVMHISKFWPRPGTPAAKLPQLPSEVVAHRSKVITDLFHNISQLQNERWSGWEGQIIINEQGKEQNQWIGRTPSYKPVLVEGDFHPGDELMVKIEKTTMFDLRGKVVGMVVEKVRER